MLEAARLIRRERDAQRRRRRLEGVALKEAVDWLARYRRFCEQRFDALAEWWGPRDFTIPVCEIIPAVIMSDS